MKLMDAIKPYVSLALVVLLTANLLSTINLTRSIEEKMNQLLISQNNTQKAVQENQQQVNNLSSNLQNELERQASLFSESSSVVTYSAEGY